MTIKKFKSFLKSREYVQYETVPFLRKAPLKEELELLDEAVKPLRKTLRSALGNVDTEKGLGKKWYDKHRTIIDTLDKRLSEHYNFDEDDRDHIRHFTDYSGDINRHLINNNKPEKETSKPVKQFFDSSDEDIKLYHQQIERHAQALDKMLGQHVSPSADFHVYTGLKRSPLELHKEATGEEHDGKSDFHGIFHHFASTTTNPSVARSFAHSSTQRKLDNNPESSKEAHVIKFKIPAKSKHGAYIAEHSEYPEEHEFLLKRNKKFKIHPVPEEHEYELKPKKIGEQKTKQKLLIWHGSFED